MNKSTAILIFAQSAERESKLKLFLKSEVLFSELNKHTLSTVEKSGLPYFHFSEKEQNGPTFAERYVNAIQSVYDQGYDTVITIGNDTPQLTTKHLHHTVEKLQECPIVLGPSMDGGYYLMGLHKSQFDPEVFLKLPWQTSRLMHRMQQVFSAKKTAVVLLNKLQDIDTAKDAKKLADGFKAVSYRILQVLRSLFTSEDVPILKYVFFIPIFQKEIYYNKGSPFYL